MNELAASLAKFDRRLGPRIGDYVITPDGVYRRIACDWGYELQTGTDGSFHLSDRNEGHMNFCGRLDLVIPRKKITPTGEIRPGTCQFGFEQQEIPVDYKVWRTEGAYRLKFRTPPLQRPMVVELLGASGVGKTTIAAALAEQLQRKGYTVRTITSNRDRLLARSLLRGIQTLWSFSPQRSPLTSSLTRLLPPRNPLWNIRLRGYCSRMLGQTTNGAEIVIQDQGWTQFICSLALLSGIDDVNRIAKALELIPKPDFVVRIDAPLEVTEMRVRQRHLRLSTVQRWLELDSQTAASQIKVIKMVTNILSGNGQRLIEINCQDVSAQAIETMLPEIEPYQWT